jgi:5-methylcytosine-specific restriction enzyme subunit McrC
MKIPVRNIYYLLLYAWGHFRGGVAQDVGSDSSPDLPNMLVKVLLDGAHRLLRRGLDRGYKTTIEEVRSPQGRLCLDLMMKQQTLLRGIAVCEIDELTHNVLHNQILKATLHALANCYDIKKDLRHELRLTSLRMDGVTPIRLSANIFHRVQLSRNTAQYGLIMRVCEFIFQSLLPDEQGINSRFQSILEDKTRMSTIFEEFLRNFYRSELTEYTVGAEIMPWDAKIEDDEARAALPVMKTDITLRSESRTIIADAKFYKDTLATGLYGDRIHSTHLYQLATYLAHARKREGDRDVLGLLIYPKVSKSIQYRYDLLGFPVVVATIDLAAEWPDIRSSLLALVLDQNSQISTLDA